MQESAKVLPEWISVEFLQNAIRAYKSDNSIEIIDFLMKSIFDEHFASTMFQCKIDFNSSNFECESLDVVVKAKPITDGIKAVASEGPLFENEIRMYTKTIPAFQELYKRSGLEIEFAPELIYATVHPFPIIILKDLTADGYFASRIPFELDTSKLLVQRLAQFHAASYYLNEMNGEDFSNYSYNVYQNEALIYGLYNSSIKAFKEVLQTWDGYQQYIPKIETFMKQIGEIGRTSHTPNDLSKGYNVLNHGDFHMRNILVKLNQQTLQRCCFIDYQLSVYCSPAIDLNYVWGLVQRDGNLYLPYKDLVTYYHQEFETALKSLGFSKYIPSLIDLNIELIRHGRTNVLMQIVFFPLAFIDWQTTRIDQIMGTGENDEVSMIFKKNLYNNPKCKTLMQQTLKDFTHKGWL